MNKKTVRIIVTFLCSVTFFLSFFHADLTRADSFILPNYGNTIPLNQLSTTYNNLTINQKGVADYIVGSTMFVYLNGRNWIVKWSEWSDKNFDDMVEFLCKLGQAVWDLTYIPLSGTLDWTEDLINYLSNVLGFSRSYSNDFYGGAFHNQYGTFGVPYNEKIINGYNKLFRSNDTIMDLWEKYFPEAFNNPTIIPEYNDIFTNITNEINKVSFTPDNITNYSLGGGYVDTSAFLTKYKEYKASSEWIDIDPLSFYMTFEDGDNIVFLFSERGKSNLIVNKSEHLACWQDYINVSSGYWLDSNPVYGNGSIGEYEMKTFYSSSYVRSYGYEVITDRSGNILHTAILVDKSSGFLSVNLVGEYGFFSTPFNSPKKFHLPFVPFDTDQFDAAINEMFRHTFDIEYGYQVRYDCLMHNVKMYEFKENTGTNEIYVFDDNDNPSLDNSGDPGYSIVPPDPEGNGDPGYIDIIPIPYIITPPEEPDPDDPEPEDPAPNQPVVSGPSVVVDNYYTYEGDQYTYNEFNYTYNYYYYPSNDTFTKPSLDVISNFLNQDFDFYVDGDNPFDSSYQYDNKNPFQYMSYMWSKTKNGFDFLSGCLHAFDESGASAIFAGGLVSLAIAGFFSKLLG